MGAQIAVYPLMMMGLGVRDDARYRNQIPPRNLFPLSHSSRKSIIHPRHCSIVGDDPADHKSDGKTKLQTRLRSIQHHGAGALSPNKIKS